MSLCPFKHIVEPEAIFVILLVSLISFLSATYPGFAPLSFVNKSSNVDT